MNFALLNWEDLTPRQQLEVPDNGSGKEYASYMQATHLGKVLWLQSDAMEPEDACFFRDLSWIRIALDQAYNIGLGTDDPTAKDGDQAKDVAKETVVKDGDQGTEAQRPDPIDVPTVTEASTSTTAPEATAGTAKNENK